MQVTDILCTQLQIALPQRLQRVQIRGFREGDQLGHDEGRVIVVQHDAGQQENTLHYPRGVPLQHQRHSLLAESSQGAENHQRQRRNKVIVILLRTRLNLHFKRPLHCNTHKDHGTKNTDPEGPRKGFEKSRTGEIILRGRLESKCRMEVNQWINEFQDA